MIKKIKKLISDSVLDILISLSIVVSICGFIYFYSDGLSLLYGDAVSRLDISRKIVDNLTPGIGQIGSVWLPLPILLMTPFTANYFLWQTGIAGYIISGISFVFTIVFLYKLGTLAFSSKFAGAIMALFALSSINLIYIQTTAMAESLFIMTIMGTTYFIYRWAKTGQVGGLILGALFASAASFTRYEGFFLVGVAFLLVPVISFIKNRNWKQIEGILFLFSTLAFTGIILWIVYNWAIFGDPLYWKDIYTGQASIISSEVLNQVPEVAKESRGFSIGRVANSIYAYWSATAQMNGIIITALATIGLLVFPVWLIFKKKVLKKPENLVLLLPLGIFIFVVISAYGGFPLTLPALTIENLLTKDTNNIGEYNIRYGLNMLPLVAIFIGWVAARAMVLKLMVGIILIVQVVTTFYTPFFTTYSIPVNFQSNASSAHTGENPGSEWLKNNYDGGLIMISAQNHNPTMFYLGLPYKTYIHEGAGKYWLESRKNPQMYATWLFMYYPPKDITKTDDGVTKYASKNPNTLKYFDKVFDDGSYLIYKIKNKPEIEILQ